MRDERFDSLKFELIILVCWGHLIQIDKNAFSGETIALYKLIYTFHVPLFAFVSGFFTNSNKDYSKSFVSLLEIIFWGDILWFIFSGTSVSVMSLLTPQYHLWYLMGLIWWRIMIHCTHKYLNKWKLLILSFSVSLIIGGAKDFWPFSISITLTQFPFFVAGNLFRDHKKWLEKFYSFHWMYGIIPFAIVYFIYLEIPTLGDEAHHMANYGLLWRYVDRFSFLVFASLLGASFLLLHSKITYPRSFATFGRNNLIFYVYHGFLRFLPCYLYVHDIVPLNIWSVSIMTGLIFIIISVVSKFSWSYVLMNPISFFIRLILKLKRT